MIGIRYRHAIGQYIFAQKPRAASFEKYYTRRCANSLIGPVRDIDAIAVDVFTPPNADVAEIDADAEIAPLFGRRKVVPLCLLPLHLYRAAQRNDHAVEFP